ncbi:histamine H2 receptor-like [Montipora capricornis]|uniref:histamine H2 receptor-like n=1 Tax=Montipora foliosa TaxID=591990 RepID=UPI0035F18CC0
MMHFWNKSTASIAQDGASDHTVDRTLLIPLSVTWAVLGLMSTVLNLAVCFIVMIERRLWTITNAFVVSLSVADLLVASALFPIYIYEKFSVTTEPLTGYVIAFLLLASIFNMGAVTYERYIALTRPIGYRVTMSTSKVTLIISLSWFVPLGMSILPLAWGADPTTKYHKVYMVVNVFGFVLLPCLAMIWVYARLLRVVRRFISRNRKRVSWGNRTGNRAGNEEKALVVFAMIFGMFLLSWMPFIFINICDIFDKPELVTDPIAYLSFYTMLLNTITDPLIYAFLKKDFSDCLRRRWRKKRLSSSSLGSRIYTQAEMSLEQSQVKRSPSS